MSRRFSPSNDNERPQKRKNRPQKTPQQQQHLYLSEVTPKTYNQELAFDYYDAEKNLVLYGSAGTGKTFLALAMALEDVVENQYYQKVVIVRSAVPSRDQGFLPGNAKEKAAIYEAPYINIVNTLFNRGDAYQILKNKELIEFITTSYVRGITLDNVIVVLDEVQNLDFDEINSVITRLGENSRIIVLGDVRQGDLERQREKSGFNKFLAIAKSMPGFAWVEFNPDDIVRSEFVKQWIIALEDSEKGFSTPIRQLPLAAE